MTHIFTETSGSSRPAPTAVPQTPSPGALTLPRLVGSLRVLVLCAVVLTLLSTGLFPGTSPTADAAGPALLQQDQGGDDGPGETTDALWMPLVGTYQMNCTWQNPPHPGPCDNHHNGWAVDIIGDMGDPIYAAGAGRIVHAFGGCSPNSGQLNCNNAAGNYLAIDNGGYLSRYIHLASFVRSDVGGWVEAGELIGYMGASGTSAGSGPHLHYDETTFFPERRLPFGPMLACVDGEAVQYPDDLGYESWLNVPYGTMLRNDGYECLGGVTVRVAPILPLPGGSAGLAIGDFRGDDLPGVAVGTPGEDIGVLANAGAVTVHQTSIDAPLLGDSSLLHQSQLLSGAVEAGDLVGGSVAAGDFNCDGMDDLAVGSPGEAIGPLANAGGVAVVYSNGLAPTAAPQGLYQGFGAMPDQAQEGDLLGAGLATGDFNGDGCEDLAIGVPGEDNGAIVNAGAVQVVYGHANGLNAGIAPEPLLFEGNGLTGVSRDSDLVGAVLASGDFNCDDVDDLAVGIPGDDIDGLPNAGSVRIVLGSTGAGMGQQLAPLYQTVGITGVLESHDYLGAALDAGDVNNDGCDDLVVGVPGEGIYAVDEVGLVSVVYGGPNGMGASTVNWQSNGLLGAAEAGDRAGTSVAVTDINCDGIDDVLIGTPGEGIGALNEAGMINVLYGSADGVQPSGGDGWHQANFLSGNAEAGDLVGASLAGGDLDNDGCGDLIIGAPGEAIGPLAGAGIVHVVLGSPTGPVDAGYLSQLGPVPGVPETGDAFGGPSIRHLLNFVLAE